MSTSCRTPTQLLLEFSRKKRYEKIKDCSDLRAELCAYTAAAATAAVSTPRRRRRRRRQCCRPARRRNSSVWPRVPAKLNICALWTCENCSLIQRSLQKISKSSWLHPVLLKSHVLHSRLLFVFNVAFVRRWRFFSPRDVSSGSPCTTEDVLSSRVTHYWSPDNRFICYAELDDTGVPLQAWPWYGDRSDVYGRTIQIAYPKVLATCFCSESDTWCVE